MLHIIYINHNCQINRGRSKMLVYLYSGSDMLKGHLMAYSATLLSNTTHRIKRKINRLEWLCCSALKMAACCYCCWNIPSKRLLSHCYSCFIHICFYPKCQQCTWRIAGCTLNKLIVNSYWTYCRPTLINSHYTIIHSLI